MDFSYSSYHYLIELLLTHGYRFSLFTENPDEMHVYYRHDVDTDFLGTLELASIESEHGVHSTWFFLPDCTIYNLLSSDLFQVIDTLDKKGHSIGLHIDASRYPSLEAMSDDMDEQYVFFSKRLPIQKIVSFHRPAQWLLNDIQIDGWINAYEAKFYSDIVYISDSNRREFWQETRLSDALDTGKSMTVLTHPLWWHATPLDSLATYHHACEVLGSQRVGTYLQKTCKRYQTMGEKI